MLVSCRFTGSPLSTQSCWSASFWVLSCSYWSGTHPLFYLTPDLLKLVFYSCVYCAMILLVTTFLMMRWMILIRITMDGRLLAQMCSGSLPTNLCSVPPLVGYHGDIIITAHFHSHLQEMVVSFLPFPWPSLSWLC